MKDFVLQYFTLLNLYFYLSKGSEYLLHHCCAAPRLALCVKRWRRPHGIPVCHSVAGHMFSQGLCVEGRRVGTTYIPHPLVDLPELSLC